MFSINCVSNIICKGGTDYEVQEDILFFYSYGCTVLADDFSGAVSVYFRTAFFVQCKKQPDGAESADTADYQKEVTEKLENCSVDGVSAFTVDFTKGEGTLTFQVPVSESQQLSVVLTLPAPSDCQDGYYRITQWTTETTDSWDGDDTYQLLSPIS